MNCRSLMLPASLVLALGSQGCGLDRLFGIDKPKKPQAEEVQPLTAEELCAMYLAQDTNQGRVGTDDPGWVLCTVGPTATADDFSDAVLARECRPGTAARTWADDLLRAVDEKRVVIDWEIARDCLDESRRLRTSGPSFGLVGTEEWEGLRTGACQAFYKAGVADGGACKDAWDCNPGSGCYADNPYDPNGAKCLPEGKQGDNCDPTFHPCAAEYFCGQDGKCDALKAGGADCSDDSECLSGSCDYEAVPSVCTFVVPPTSIKQIGDPCTDTEECGGSCVACRPSAAGGPTTCQVLGGEGDYCRDWNDCVLDLGCTNNTCTTVGAGEVCALSGDGNNQSLCTNGLYCLPAGGCDGVTADTCTGANCQWVPGDGVFTDDACVEVTGTCGALPESGDCFMGQYCAAGFFCTDGGSCQKYADAGEACSTTGDTAPICRGCDTSGYCDSLSCVGGTCQYPCEFKEDCPAGQYCDTSAVPSPECVPETPEACDGDEQCPNGQYCNFPGAICGDLATEGDCGGNSACSWDVYTSCDNKIECMSFDGDETSCNGQGGACVYDATSGWCDPTVSCNGFATQPDCDAQAGACEWTEVGYCSAAVYTGSCMPHLNTGDACDPSQGGADCTSGYCSEDPDGNPRCEVDIDTSGCSNNNAGFLQFTFLFGGVLMLLKNKLRRRKR